MSVEINITEDDIKYAENILLSDGRAFDSESSIFIRNFETIDLQAVPGSGKTTCLLAKLLILEKKLPLKNNTGILILSHTNIAIEEIKERIETYCPKLFSYPNFIGTIQSFVDQFIAIPFAKNFFNVKINRIDTEIFKEELWKEFQKIYWDKAYNEPGKLFWQRHNRTSIAMSKSSGIDANIICKQRIEDEVKDLYFDFKDGKIKIFRDNSTILADANNLRYQAIKSCVLKVIYSGYISYEYAYKLTDAALHYYPRLKNILQNRFEYVFVDEMQDMDEQQYMLLESLFYDEGRSKSKYQRIGDKNQAIYNGLVLLNDIWQNRGNPLNINGSKRLNKNIAELVNCFALNRDGDFQVIGLNINNIKPHLIVFTSENIKQVLPKYSEIIYKHITTGVISNNIKNTYKAIGWVKEKADGKLGIKDYCEMFNPQVVKKTDYPHLDCYLKLIDIEKGALEPVRKNILNALLKVLKIEKITVSDANKNFTKRELLEYLSRNFNPEYLLLKSYVYNWCIELIRGRYDEVYLSVKKYIPEFLKIFDKKIETSLYFVNTKTENIFHVSTQTSDKKANNVFNYNGLDIELSTIHGVKGQTHTATLYLETFYNQGKGNYESERLFNQFKYNLFDNNTIDVVKQSTKMAYVGFSRPKELLCVAIHKERFDSYLSDVDKQKWEVIYV